MMEGLVEGLANAIDDLLMIVQRLFCRHKPMVIPDYATEKLRVWGMGRNFEVWDGMLWVFCWSEERGIYWLHFKL